MNLRLVRRWLDTICSMGELFDGAKLLCYTLERPLGFNRPKLDAIPYGNYTVNVAWSPHLKMLVPKLLNVPGRTDILIHKGNTVADTEGCILVGADAFPDVLLHSAIAYEALMAKLTFPFTLTILAPEASEGA